MTFERLTRRTFAEENINNDYVSWDIGKQPLSPRYMYDGITESDYRRIIQSKTRLDEAVYCTVLEYVNDDNLCYDRESMFPSSHRLTGNFYISDENYYSCEDGIKGSKITHFRELFCGGATHISTEQDYLGLEVLFHIHHNGHIEITGIDSSSI